MLALGGLPSLRVVVVGLVAAAAGFLAVFSLNDLLERHVAAVSSPVGAGGACSSGGRRRSPASRARLRRARPAPFAGVGPVAGGHWPRRSRYTLAPLCLLLFGMAVALDIAYCALRPVTAWKTLVAGAMVGFGGLAGWAAVAPLVAAGADASSGFSRCGRSAAATSPATWSTSTPTASAA